MTDVENVYVFIHLPNNSIADLLFVCFYEMSSEITILINRIG